MEKYISRKYLREKWRKVQRDMEYLQVMDDELDDKVENAMVNQVKYEIYNNFRAICRELMED